MFKKSLLFLFCCLVLTKPVMALESRETAYVTELNDTQFENFVQNADKPVIVDFWAPWCPPCRKVKPVFEEVAKELNELYLFVSINIDEGQQMAQKYGVTSIPTFKVIKNNTVIATFTGSTDKESLIKQIHDAVQEKITQDTLLSAIQADDKELVAKCLAHEDIDVNGITQINIMGVAMPMTPLMMAVSTVIYGHSSPEIVSMLLKAGAQIDLELDFPNFDASGAIVGWVKVSARSLVEEAARFAVEENANGRSEEELAAIVKIKAKAAGLLELFQAASAR